MWISHHKRPTSSPLPSLPSLMHCFVNAEQLPRLKGRRQRARELTPRPPQDSVAKKTPLRVEFTESNEHRLSATDRRSRSASYNSRDKKEFPEAATLVVPS